MLVHIFFSRIPCEEDLFIPSIKTVKLKLRAILRIWWSLHSTGWVGFESNAEAPALFIPLSTMMFLCVLEAQRLQSRLGVQHGQDFKTTLENQELSHKKSKKLEFELLLKTRKFLAALGLGFHMAMIQGSCCVCPSPWCAFSHPAWPLRAFELVSLRATCWQLS